MVGVSRPPDVLSAHLTHPAPFPFVSPRPDPHEPRVAERVGETLPSYRAGLTDGTSGFLSLASGREPPAAPFATASGPALPGGALTED